MISFLLILPPPAHRDEPRTIPLRPIFVIALFPRSSFADRLKLIAAGMGLMVGLLIEFTYVDLPLERGTT